MKNGVEGNWLGAGGIFIVYLENIENNKELSRDDFKNFLLYIVDLFFFVKSFRDMLVMNYIVCDLFWLMGFFFYDNLY